MPCIPSSVSYLSDLHSCFHITDPFALLRKQLAAAGKRLGSATIAEDAIAGLAQAGVAREPLVDHGLRFVRRRIGDATWYFVANHGASSCRGWTDLAADFVSASRHDPMTGQSALLPTRKRGDARQLWLELHPGETLLIQASQREQSGLRWTALEPAGDSVPIEGAWQVDFIAGGPVLPQGYTTNALGSWADAPDVRARAFAGTARSRVEWEVADPRAADDWLLNLGDIRESARVRVNGREVGALVALPFHLRIRPALKAGRNTLEIEVTNTSANRIRDLDQKSKNWRIMTDINIVNPHYKAFDAAAWPIKPAGLLGPVTLSPLKALEIANRVGNR